jgi:hypothetical protein
MKTTWRASDVRRLTGVRDLLRERRSNKKQRGSLMLNDCLRVLPHALLPDLSPISPRRSSLLRLSLGCPILVFPTSVIHTFPDLPRIISKAKGPEENERSQGAELDRPRKTSVLGLLSISSLLQQHLQPVLRFPFCFSCADVTESRPVVTSSSKLWIQKPM